MIGVRHTPCASCPYRRDVPSGVWAAQEYAKLPSYDGDLSTQPPRAFGCHATDGDTLCAGWVGHRDPWDLLALRLGVAYGAVAPEVLSYRTDVELFGSGAEAAAHGVAEIDNPSRRAHVAIAKIRYRQWRRRA